MSGLSRLRNMFRVPDLRNKILFTIFIIFIFRMGSHIPVPYVDFKQIKILQESTKHAGGTLGLLDMFAGGASTSRLGVLSRDHAVHHGVDHHQPPGLVIPKLEEWQNEGQTGQKKITQWTR